MRTGKVKINGKLYTICLSTRVLVNLEDQGLTLEGVMNDDRHQVRNIFTLLSLMIDAGSRWDKANGIPNAGTLTIDDLMDSTAVDNYGDIMKSLVEVVAGERRIESVPSKNAKATQENSEEEGLLA